LSPLFLAAYNLKSDAAGRDIAKKIDALPTIPSPGRPGAGMHPASLLSPAFFALDARLRFPIINGRDTVRRLLKRFGVLDASLSEQYDCMTSFYGHAGIKDAADLDQVADDLEDFSSLAGRPRKKKILKKKREQGRSLLTCH